MVPQKLLTHVYGENNSNLTQIQQVGFMYNNALGFEISVLGFRFDFVVYN